ncbi:unnamed protein product [Soboliphyme baturini]|uniref:Uncharacterized protein n=1 Tax=Soboliphyme baturini TaxID=241478 RepID=A0A183ISG2_9BILA|nr:unnamed protein product [Soboliphyme baturini]
MEVVDHYATAEAREDTTPLSLVKAAACNGGLSAKVIGSENSHSLMIVVDPPQGDAIERRTESPTTLVLRRSPSFVSSSPPPPPPSPIVAAVAAAAAAAAAAAGDQQPSAQLQQQQPVAAPLEDIIDGFSFLSFTSLEELMVSVCSESGSRPIAVSSTIEWLNLSSHCPPGLPPLPFLHPSVVRVESVVFCCFLRSFYARYDLPTDRMSLSSVVRVRLSHCVAPARAEVAETDDLLPATKFFSRNHKLRQRRKPQPPSTPCLTFVNKGQWPMD